MPKIPLDEYWPSLITQIRKAFGLNQDAFAEKLGTTQASVSRWEKGERIPSLHNQKVIEAMAAEANLASIDGLLMIINASPFPIILVDRDSNVLAASERSGFKVGVGVIEQTPSDEQQNFATFREALSASGFWEGEGRRFDYEFRIGEDLRQAVVQSVLIRGIVYAVVQRLDC